MKTNKNILIAFILNLLFSVFEFIGGFVTGSIAVISDAIHDMGDAAGIGIAYVLERKSKKQPDEKYTYGYSRYSVLGGLVTTVILIVGSVTVIFNAADKLIHPTEINYEGMIFFALVGALVNFCAAYLTKEGDSVNQRAVNLHMLEDVLGWIVVLIGAVVMRFTDFVILDPLMSMAVALFIFIHAVGNMKEVLCIILEKIPDDVSIDDIRDHLCEVDGVIDVHHIHIWSMDGVNRYGTLHVVTNEDGRTVKENVRKELSEHGIFHVTIEIESEEEECNEVLCNVRTEHSLPHHHHHH